MAELRKHSSTSVILRYALKHATTGQGLTGLTSASSGLIISTIADNEATATAYTVAGSTVETISTLGTYAAPTATKCRFKEVDATNHPGLYEFQFADARFAVASAKALVISWKGASNLLDGEALIQLTALDLYATPSTAGDIADAVHDEVVEGTTTLRQMLRGFASAMLSKASGLGTTTAVYRDVGDTKDRITATVDSYGNRSAVTRDLT